MKIGNITWLKYEFPTYADFQEAEVSIDEGVNYSLLGGQVISQLEGATGPYIIDGLWLDNMAEPEIFGPYSIEPDTDDYLININGWVWNPEAE
tara:strand:+ start:3233 stop:3511 length:279 start_codon:yes stop_codon:yes gene_type:complete